MLIHTANLVKYDFFLTSTYGLPATTKPSRESTKIYLTCQPPDDIFVEGANLLQFVAKVKKRL